MNPGLERVWEAHFIQPFWDSLVVDVKAME